jgi:hypothetical protein
MRFCDARALIVMVCLTGCSSSIRMRPFLDGYPGTITKSSATASFETPDGWRISDSKRSSFGRVSVASQSGGGSIDLLFGRLDPTGEATPEGQSQAYLRAVHSKTDPDVTMIPISEAINGLHGAIPIYYMSSGYFGHRLHAECVAAPVGISVELYAADKESMMKSLDSFKELVSSIRIEQK